VAESFEEGQDDTHHVSQDKESFVSLQNT
jgi:hypothetical protein